MLNKILALILIVICLPLFLLISLLIFLSTGLPIIYIQERVGQDERKFKMLKFRTMIIDADKLQSMYKNNNEVDGPAFKIRNDPRFTKIGRFLSHTGLDELPQFLNILKGDMNLVGPRPLPSYEYSQIDDKYKKRSLVKPGILSPWVINGYHKNTFTDWMNSDLKYVKEKSWKYDLEILRKGMCLVFELFGREIIGRFK